MEESKDIAGVAITYSKSNFSWGGCDRMEECLNTMPHKVTSKMQEYLSRGYSADEIKVALFQMGPIKAFEPDGMNALFYQKFWHIVGDDVTVTVLDFFKLWFNVA